MEFKNFRTTGKPIRISDTSGHTVIITDELTKVPAILWGQAYSQGAISEDMKVESMSSYLEEKKVKLEQEEQEEREVIKKALLEVYNKPVGYVDKDGRPLTRKVLGLLNKPVKKIVIDSVWDEIVLEQAKE